MTPSAPATARRATSLSPYDEAVPGPAPDPVLAGRFARLRALRGADPALLDEVRDLVLVVSSSRGGSTLLSELLRRDPSVVALPGEVNPYVVVAQLGAGDRRAVLAGELAAELGRPAARDDVPCEDLALQAAWRMAAQWPAQDVAPEEAAAAVERVLREDPAAWTPRAPEQTGTAALLDALRAAHPDLDLRRYDVPGAGAGDAPPGGPVGDVAVEMAPYRLLQPWRRAGVEELRTRTVVLATPRNSYRVEHLAGLFPRARVRLVHLVRNPAAAVNGLVDGWLHHGFLNVRMPRELRIAGYSDRVPWGRRWWKYDVPPGWEDVADAPLARVAAQQWRSAHEAALDAGRGREVLRVAYEDLVGAPERRRALGERLGTWLGLPDVPRFAGGVVRGLAPVMATAPPRPGRWRSREGELAPVLADPALRDLARRLGYPDDPAGWV
jgi:hypothetical protein